MVDIKVIKQKVKFFIDVFEMVIHTIKLLDDT